MASLAATSHILSQQAFNEKHTQYLTPGRRVLWDNGRITRESLSSMSIPITATPLHLPQLISAFKHYLWILKTTHAGALMLQRRGNKSVRCFPSFLTLRPIQCRCRHGRVL